MKLENIGVIVKLDDGKVYQVALNNEQLTQLKFDLIDYFDDGKIKILDTPLDVLDIEEIEKS